jgi:hypothetical protein
VIHAESRHFAGVLHPQRHFAADTLRFAHPPDYAINTVSIREMRGDLADVGAGSDDQTTLSTRADQAVAL